MVWSDERMRLYLKIDENDLLTLVKSFRAQLKSRGLLFD